MNTAERIDYYQLTRLMWWRYQIEQLDEQSQRRIVAVLAPLIEDLKRELANLTPSQIQLTDTRKADLLQWLENATQGAQDAISGTISTAAVTTAETALGVHYGILSAGGAIKSVRTAGLTAQELQAWFQSVPLGENLLTEWVDKAFEAGVRDSIFTTIQRAGVEGVGTREQVRRLLANAVEQGYELTQREAITLARTYTAQANAAAQDAVVNVNRGLLRGWTWRAILDSRLCSQCSPNDGVFFEMDEPHPPIPRHFGCRCVKSHSFQQLKTLNIDTAQLVKNTRPWTVREAGAIGAGGRKILNYGTAAEDYSGWYQQAMSVQQQEAIFGKARARLLREGKISLADTIEKGTGRVRTLEELGFDRSGERLR